MELKHLQALGGGPLSFTPLLIHRVELKPSEPRFIVSVLTSVANPPCGVETRSLSDKTISRFNVANPPCGVETYSCRCCWRCYNKVANPPCGVETFQVVLKFVVVVSVANPPCGVETFSKIAYTSSLMSSC